MLKSKVFVKISKENNYVINYYLLYLLLGFFLMNCINVRKFRKSRLNVS